MQISTKVQFEVRGARGIGKTHIVNTVIIPALEAAGIKVTRVGAERWEFDVDEIPAKASPIPPTDQATGVDEYLVPM